MDKKIQVKQAFLHTSILVPGFIYTESTLSADKVKGLKMWMTPMGLLLEGGKDAALVPSANIKVLILAEEKEEKKTTKA